MTDVIPIVNIFITIFVSQLCNYPDVLKTCLLGNIITMSLFSLCFRMKVDEMADIGFPDP